MLGQIDPTKNVGIAWKIFSCKLCIFGIVFIVMKQSVEYIAN